MSPRSLSRRLTAETGRAPGSFVRLVKLNEAQRLLAQSQLSVTEVAHAVGFQGEGTFRRAFFTEFQINPMAYRAKFGR